MFERVWQMFEHSENVRTLFPGPFEFDFRRFLNFATPDDVNAVAASSKKYVIPHFKKNMSNNGMVGWGMATKITPQGQEYSSMMTYDSYDSLKNAMKHLAGEGIIEGLPMDKLTKVTWEMRPIMKVISSTTEKE